MNTSPAQVAIARNLKATATTPPSLQRRSLASLLGLGLALSLGSTASQAQSGPALEQPAPAFQAQTADGRSLSLDSLRGKTVVLEWTNHDCPYVKKHYDSGNAQALQKEAGEQGVVWLQVISSAPGQQGHVDGPTALKLNSQRKAQVSATLLDPSGQIGRAYGAQTTPHLYIIRPDGKLAYKGGIDSIASSKPEDIAKAESYVRLALAEVAAGKKVSQASTKPYGCSVKYAAS